MSYFYPVADVSMPCISFYEASNRVHKRAAGAEAQTEVEYVIDCWATTPEATAAMGGAVDTACAALGLNREFSYDLYETDTGIHHKTMRYRATVIGNTIYQ